MTNEEFVRMADPHAWLLTADNLHEQALRMRNSARGELLIRRSSDGRSDSWDITERSTILLASFALENALKAFLVYEHPEWVSNGRLAKQLKSHRLIELRDQSKLIPYRQRYTWVLRFFEEGIESWARYPCGLSVSQTADIPNLTKTMWGGYLRLMCAYGRKLERLLQRGWKGPHGATGSWDCATMKFLRQSEEPTGTVFRV